MFFAGTQGAQVRAGAGTVLEEHAFGLGQAEDAAHIVFNAVDEAGRTLRCRLHAHIEPDRAVERGVLVQENVSQLVAKGLAVLFFGEITALPAPSCESCLLYTSDAAD